MVNSGSQKFDYSREQRFFQAAKLEAGEEVIVRQLPGGLVISLTNVVATAVCFCFLLFFFLGSRRNR